MGGALVGGGGQLGGAGAAISGIKTRPTGMSRGRRAKRGGMERGGKARGRGGRPSGPSLPWADFVASWKWRGQRRTTGAIGNFMKTLIWMIGIVSAVVLTAVEKPCQGRDETPLLRAV